MEAGSQVTGSYGTALHDVAGRPAPCSNEHRETACAAAGHGTGAASRDAGVAERSAPCSAGEPAHGSPCGDAGDVGVASFLDLPLPALAVVASHAGTRPDNFLRCCRATWRLSGDLNAWAAWLLSTYGRQHALHQLRSCTWLLSRVPQEATVLRATRLLLAGGADPNLAAPQQAAHWWCPSALHWAVVRDYASVAEALLQAGACIDDSVVCAAAAQGNTDVMAKLVNALPPHEFRKCRNYALIQAASGGEVGAAEWLLQRGADVNVNEAQALYEACYQGHIDATELLLRYGADVRARSDGALVAAAFKGYAPIVRCLIAAGADVDAQSGRALEQAAGFGRAAVVSLLLAAGATPHALSKGLVAAARKGRADIVCTLLQHGAVAGHAALGAALGGDHADVVRLLVQAGVDVRGALAPGDVQQMIMDARFASLEALEDEARRCGRETLGPSAWGISLPSFDAALLAAERARLLGLRIHALTIVRNGPTVTASNP